MSYEEPLAQEQLEAVAREALGSEVVLRSARELTEGTFNTAYALHLADGRQVVLKVAPPPDVPVLTYERHLLRTEALCLRTFARRTTVPVPQLLHVGSTSAAAPRDYVLTSLVPGASWASRAEAMAPAERRRLRRQLGRHVAAMHQVTGEERFGYPAPGSPLTGRTWAGAYQRIIAALVDDAKRYGAQLPLPAEEIGQRLSAAAETALVPIQVPVLVHFDLWDGNILVDDGPRGPVITGIIDHERALWADPAVDFASLALLSDIGEDADFLAGYRDAGGPVVLDAATRYRLHLYRAHLALVMLAETAPRGTDGPEHHDHNSAVARWLVRQLVALEDAPRPGT